MSGIKSKQKGNRREREFAKLIGGTRVSLSGAIDGYANDVKGLSGSRMGSEGEEKWM